MNRILHRFNLPGKVVALTALVSLATMTRAKAHAFIDKTDPLVGGKVAQAPAEVRLWYTQGLEPAFSHVQVLDAAGKEVDQKDARVDPKNNHRLSVSLPPGLGAGTYKVVWRVVSVDTHVTEGSFTFRVEP